MHATHDSDAGNVSTSTKSSVSLLSRALLLITLLASIFLIWQHWSLNKTEKALNTSIETKKAKLAERNQYTAENTGQNIILTLEKAKSLRTQWSKIYTDIMALEQKGIELTSFTAGPDLSFTVSGQAPQMSLIGQLVYALKQSPKFQDPFVGKINESRKDDSQAFSFNLTFRYIPSS